MHHVFRILQIALAGNKYSMIFYIQKLNAYLNFLYMNIMINKKNFFIDLYNLCYLNVNTNNISILFWKKSVSYLGQYDEFQRKFQIITIIQYDIQFKRMLQNWLCYILPLAIAIDISILQICMRDKITLRACKPRMYVNLIWKKVLL